MTSPVVVAPSVEALPVSSRRREARGHVVGVAAVAVSVFAIHALRVVQHWHEVTFYRGFDEVIFDQAVRAYSEFRAPEVPLKGVYAGAGEHFLQLGDHFSPIHALLAPLYWIWDDVRMLLLAQAAMYAVAAVVLWRFTRRLLGAVPAYLVSVAFGVSWGLQAATDTGYHELDWAVPLVALVLERAQAGRHRQALLAAVALLLVKEEMGLVVAAVGVLFALRGRRRSGVLLAVGGLLWFGLTVKVVVPAFGGSSTQYWSYGSLGPTPGAAARFAVTHPLSVLHLAVATPDKQQLLLWLLLLSVGASLLSPIVLLAVPSVALRLLSDNGNYATVHFHYNAWLMVVLLAAGVDGVARVVRWASPPGAATAAPPGSGPDRATLHGMARSLVLAWAVAVCFVAAYGVTTPLFGFSHLADTAEWQQTPYQRAAAAVVEQIPVGATVEADDALAMRISARTGHLLLVDGHRHGSDYVVLGTGPQLSFVFSSREQVLQLRQDYLDHGYRQVWQQDGVVVLQRVG